ncbi:endolytic transglycosylase MltG [Patescibacteria group bacterium]
MNKVKEFIVKNKKIILIILVISIVAKLFFYYFYVSPPKDFPLNKVITVEKGTAFKKVAQDFEEQKLIRSSFWFDVVGWFLMNREDVKAGEYFFEKRKNIWSLNRAMTSDIYQDNLISITIPEGYDLRNIAFFFENKGMWQAEELWEITGLPVSEESMEGYLFPDTYYVPANISPDSLVKIMRENFEKKVPQEMKGRDIVTMASLLEKEAANQKDRKLISGILWKRIEAGMALQVDAVFPYFLGKNSLQLTFDDLKVDSPYNTYLYKGLPPGPIANPGLWAIKAAFEPTESNYWFYLSDKEGTIHYSSTYKEHLAKRQKYLGK